MYDAWKRGFGVADAPTLVWQAPTRTMNSTIAQAVVDEALADDEVAARSEWLAAWRDDVASFISPEALEAVTIPGRIELPPTADRPAFAFCDPAGGTGKDFFALAIGHRDADRVIVDKLVEVLPPFDPDAATRELAAVLHAYRVSTVVGDKYAGAWPTSRFAAHGIHYRESEKVRSDPYRDALPVITAQRCEFPDNKKLQRQWLSFDRTVSKSGRETIDASRGARTTTCCNVVAGLLCIPAAPRMQASTIPVIGW
ncbi:MAG TPA: hypothetical protein VL049_19910 [Candidatus Dormibacteraeota bacterium]|nr:hypothetical protein [Candidatus Dormibacteraeota bacterium]